MCKKCNIVYKVNASVVLDSTRTCGFYIVKEYTSADNNELDSKSSKVSNLKIPYN